jgi:hypothetical protein
VALNGDAWRRTRSLIVAWLALITAMSDRAGSVAPAWQRCMDRQDAAVPASTQSIHRQPSSMNLDQLSEVISHATAPAFLLGAVSGFVAVLIARMNGIIDRIRTLNAIADDDLTRAYLKSDLTRLKRRAKLLNDAIFFAVASAICTILLVILAFGAAFLTLQHEPGVALMFVLALSLLGVSLFMLAWEVRIALNEYDHHA